MHALPIILMLLAAEPAPQMELPHLRVDRAQRTIDIDAEVVYEDDFDWIELLACTPKTRTYESIFAVRARPSHIHLALLTLNVEPGAPMQWQYKDDSIETTPPRGPRVRVSVITEHTGERKVTPAGQWIINQKTGQPMEDSIWLFTGSGFADLEGESVYRADVNGTVLSVVNFGDDMLARPTGMHNQTDEQTWNGNRDLIPPKGTAVTLRLTVLDEQPAEKRDKAPAE